MDMEETKRCPYCGEEILTVAKKCKHCGEWLEEEPKRKDLPKSETEDVCRETYVTEHEKDKGSILRGFGKEIIGALVVLCLGYAVYLLIGEKIPSYEGRWEHKSTTTETDFDDDSPITEWTENETSIDMCLSDRTEIETARYEITVKIDDGDYRGTILMKYNTRLSGTWEQHGQTLTFAGTDYEWELVEAEVSPENEDGTYYLNEVYEILEDEQSEIKEECVGKQWDVTIVGVDYGKNKLFLDCGDGYIESYSKLDSDIKKMFYWKPFKDKRVGKKVRVKRKRA